MPPRIQYVPDSGGIDVDFPHEMTFFRYHHTARPLQVETTGGTIGTTERRSFDQVFLGIDKFPVDEAFADDMTAFWSFAAKGGTFVFDHLGSVAKSLKQNIIFPATPGVAFRVLSPFKPWPDAHTGPGFRYKMVPRVLVGSPHVRDLFSITGQVEAPVGEWTIASDPLLRWAYPIGSSVWPEHSYEDCFLVQNADPIIRLPGGLMSLRMSFRTAWPIEIP